MDNILLSFNGETNSIEFIHIYIDEAHPKDGWYIGGNESIYSHKTIQDRSDASKYISQKVDNVYLDTMDNNLKHFFGVQYERLYIIKNNTIVFQGGQGPMNYSLSDVEKFLGNTV